MNRGDLFGLSEADLVDIGSPGLVRRARQELSDSALSARVEATGDDIHVRWSDGIECHFPPGSSLRGHCTCPAVGLCRHLVRSVLFLQSQPDALTFKVPSAEPTRSQGRPTIDTLLALSPAEFEKEMGKRAIKSARKLLAGVSAQVSQTDARKVSFPAMGITVRFPPECGLNLAICNCSKPPPCSHVLPALLVLRGESIASPTPTTVPAAQPEWTEAIRRTEELLDDLFRMGLDGLSLAWCEAATTTAMEIRKCGLTVPADLLDRLGQEVKDELTKNPRALRDRLRWNLAALWLRVLAWRSGKAEGREEDLISRPPHVYWAASARTLVGVGVQGWSNDELVGLTLYLLDLAAGAIVSTGTARPRYSGLDVRSLAASAPVIGGYTAREILGKQLAADSSRLTTGGRIRMASDARIEVLPTPFHWQSLIREHGVDRWSRLADRLERSFPMLVTLEGPPVYWFAPAEMEPPAVCSARQDFIWPMLDLDGRRLAISYRYSAERSSSFQEIRSFALLHTPAAVLGSLRWTAGEARVEPLTLLYADHGCWTPFFVDIDRAARAGRKHGKTRVARRC